MLGVLAYATDENDYLPLCNQAMDIQNGNGREGLYWISEIYPYAAGKNYTTPLLDDFTLAKVFNCPGARPEEVWKKMESPGLPTGIPAFSAICGIIRPPMSGTNREN